MPPPEKARPQHRLEAKVKVMGKVTPISWAGAWGREMGHLDQTHRDLENPIPNLGSSRQTSNLPGGAPKHLRVRLQVWPPPSAPPTGKVKTHAMRMLVG